MPDLKTALVEAINKSRQDVLHKTIEEWSEDDKQPQPQSQPQEKTMTRVYTFQPTNNVSRATFDFVLNNPGLDLQKISDALEAQGYKKSSTTSLLSQMRRSNLVHRDSMGCYAALTPQYTPIKNGKLNSNKRLKPGPKVGSVQKPRVQGAGIAALKVDTTAPAPAPVVVSNDVEYILSTLPIKQARALYDELHKIFGRAA